LCIDPVDLNEAIKQPYYPIPTFDDALSNQDGAVYFTKLDARSGYWILQLSEKASYLTTFSVVYGRYSLEKVSFWG
jgi:hypothetical protein